jgi:C-terminal processing protease CtpA/Prc
VQLDTGDVAGYFLDGEHADTAVLSVTSFASNGDQSVFQGFQTVVAKFLAACKEAGKTKLILDMTNNGGGTIFVGYDLFKQVSIFPTLARNATLLTPSPALP